MKKTLLLSVVASTMIMAGAPVEPVEAPVAAASAWDFSGQGVVYYQTVSDKAATPVQTAGHTTDGDMFSQENSSATVGLQLNATNSDLFAGIGAGFQVSGLGTLGLDEDVVSAVMQTGAGSLNSGAWTKGYLTYGTGNTSIKIGRQELPKALSPFAYSEGWNVFKNTFGAALVVNTDVTDTTLVGAYVMNANYNLSDFNDINEDGVYMLTAQNKSFEDVTLTGTWYYAPDMLVTDDINVLWADAKANVAGLNVALQGGTVLGADDVGGEDTTAFGAKVGGSFGGFDASVAFSTVNDGSVSIQNLGQAPAAKSPLYTQMILNNLSESPGANPNGNIGSDNDTWVFRAGTEALGGNCR
jgi:hypothetical protein